MDTPKGNISRLQTCSPEDVSVCLREAMLEVEIFYNDGKVLMANQLCSTILSTIKKYQLAIAEDVLGLWEQKAALRTTIKDDSELVQSLIDEWSKTQEWEQSHKGDEYSVAFKQLTDSPFIKLKLEGTVPCSLFNFIAVINEIDLFTNWVPCIMGAGLKACKEVGRPSRLRVLGHLDIGFPWPLKGRDLAVDGFGVDLLEERGQVMIVLRNAPSADLPVRDCPRVDLISGGALITPLGADQTMVSFIICADPKLDIIPTWLINWGLKTFSGYFYSQMTYVATNIGKEKNCPFKQNMDSRPEFYGFLQERLDDYYTNKQ